MRKFLVSIAICCLGVCLSATENSYDILLSPCRTARSWKFLNGGEFPGAKGGWSIDENSNKVKLNYGFTGGGKYVATCLNSKLPEKIESFKLSVKPLQNLYINCRILDANGRTFQGQEKLLKANQEAELIFSVKGPWTNSWGGKGKNKLPQQPLQKFFFTIGNKGEKTGTVLFYRFSAKASHPLESKVKGTDFSIDALGWRMKGHWVSSLEGISLDINAENINGLDTDLSITLPSMMRDNVQRFKLDAKRKKVNMTYLPPLKDGGNEFNKYELTFAMTNSKGVKMAFPVVLRGLQSDSVNFGAPTNSKNIKSSSVGTAVHFSYGRSGAFKGWRDYKTLLDDIAACGIKWIRDGYRLKKDENGNYSVDKYDLGWIKYAKEKGISTILVIDVKPRITIGEYEKIINAVVRDTKAYVNVYELGNEPHNFGGWRKLGGPWNGKGKDNKASPWVIEHLKYTNALADYVKAACPEATVIGIGACTPTNYRYLDLGVTKNLDGVVDHPYTYSMPPEIIPFGWAFEERDGVKTGDENFTFKGMIDAYVEQFKKTGQMRSLWVTEFGYTTFWFNDSKKNGKFGLYAGVTEETQAVYLVRRFIESFTLPIAVTCQYDFIDDYGSSMYHDESNFGIIRADHSRKPAYLAIQQMCSLFNDYTFDKTTEVVSEKQTLHRSCRRSVLVADWDKVTVTADNNIRAYPFKNAELPKERMLAVWSALPYTREFNNRITTIRIKGWGSFAEKPVAIDVVNGKSYSVPMKVEGEDLLLENLSLKGNPIVIKFFKK